MARRGDLHYQLKALSERRAELSVQWQGASPATRSSLDARIKALDDRSAIIEQQILDADMAITNAFARMSAEQTSGSLLPPPALPSSLPERSADRDIISAAVMIPLALVALGVFIHKRAWRKAEKKFSRAGSGEPQIERLQEAIDVIALEVERISEGQRFVSKLLAERLQPSTPPRVPDGIPVDNKSLK
jgi:hypothetical protein